MKEPLKLMPLRDLDKVVAAIAKLPKEAVLEPQSKRMKSKRKQTGKASS